jgi:hypothetical protein
MFKRINHKLLFILALTMALLLAVTSIVMADVLHNDIVATPASITLTAGEGSVDVQFYVQPTGGDEDQQCNFDTTTEHLTFLINTPSGVIANPASLTFNKCHDGAEFNYQSVTFSANTSAVSGNVSFTEIENNSGGTFTYDQAEFDIYIETPTPEDNTPPELSLPADITEEATGPSGAAVTFTATANDLVDGSVPVTCVPASGSTFPLGTTEVSCSATDTAGNEAQGSFNITVVDTTPPTIDSHADVGPIEATGPSGAAVSYTAPATHDLVDGDGVATCAPASGSTFALGDTTVTCNATDAHGNAATPTTFKVTVVDTTPPTIDSHADVGPIEATGLDGAIVTYTSPATHDLVDGDGVATCAPASDSTFALGDTTVTCTATDAHGNAATPTSFKVMVRVQLLGFYQPVDMDGVINVVKGGSTVPLKFEIFAGSTEITDVEFVGDFTTSLIVCGTGVVEDTIETLATGGTSLRYDPVAGQFIFNWKTPKNPGKCYQVTLAFDDGSTLVAYFRLK